MSKGFVNLTTEDTTVQITCEAANLLSFSVIVVQYVVHIFFLC